MANSPKTPCSPEITAHGIQKLYDGLQDEHHGWKTEIKTIVHRTMATGHGILFKQLASMDEPLMRLAFLYEEEARNMNNVISNAGTSLPPSIPNSRKRILTTPKSNKKMKVEENSQDVTIGGTPVIDITE